MGEGVGRQRGGILSLLTVIEKHCTAVEFDLIRYGLRLDWLGSEALSWRDLYVIVAQSGPDTAIYRSMNDEWPQTIEADLLRAVELNTRVIAWQGTRDGQRGNNRPEPFLWPWERKQDKAIRGDAMTIEEALDFLGWDRQMRDPNHDEHEAFPDDDEGGET